MIAAIVVIAVLVALMLAVSMSNYRDDRRVAVDDQARLAFESTTDSSQYLRGRLDVLSTLATRRSFVSGDATAVRQELARFPTEQMGLVGGIAWFSPSGDLLAPQRTPSGPTSAEARDVVTAATEREVVSAALRSGEFEGEVTLLAVPTFDEEGGVNGVLGAGMSGEWLAQVSANLDQTRGSTTYIFDRAGALIVGQPGMTAGDSHADLERFRPENLDRVETLGSLTFAGRSGMIDPSGRPGQVVGSARDDRLSGWTLLQVNPESVVFAPAQRTLGLVLRRLLIAVLVAGVATAVVGRRLNSLARRTRLAEDDVRVERARTIQEASNLRLVLHATATGWFRWQPGTDRLDWSPVVDELLLPPGGAPPSVRAALESVHPDERMEVTKQLSDAVAARHPVEVEFRLADAETVDGGDRWVWLHMVPVEERPGADVMYAGLVREVTELRGAQNELLRAAGRERQIARLLQQSMLPGRLPPVEGLAVTARYRSAGPDTLVGGDFYDLIVRVDGCHVVVIGDVCGHGIEAASATSLARHTLRAAAQHGAADPAEQLRWLHEALVTSEDHSYVTSAAGCGRVVGDTYHLELALAGHPPPILIRKGTAETIGVCGTLLGVFEPTIVSSRFELRRGDRLVFYTDGLTDSALPRLDEHQLQRLLLDVTDLPLEEFADEVLRISEPSSDSTHDDTALLVIDVVGDGRRSYEV
jgi:PAS domain-containing protein